MIDDNTIGDAARNPGDETPGSVVRTGVRAAAKKAVRKVAKKTAKKATKKVAKKAAKKTAGAGGRSGDGRARKKTAEKAAKPAAATPAVSETIVADAAPAPAASEAVVREVALPETSASDAAAASEIAPPGATIPETAADGSPPAAKRALPADAARWIGPTHPGAHMTGADSEDAGGIGGFLALWGPLVIIGFLVLVFWGGDERETATAHGPDASPAPASTSAASTSAASAMTPVAAGTEAPQTSVPAPDPGDAVLARAFGEAGASPFPAASRAAAAWTDSGGAWPAPPGPYRTPGSRELPVGERWVAHVGEWAPAADGRGASGYGADSEPPPQWVRCEAPYYWCPAPSNPAW